MASTTLPAGWANRLVPVSNENTAGAIGWCLDVHDLALSKLVAGRDRDLELAVVRARLLMTESAATPPNSSRPGSTKKP